MWNPGGPVTRALHHTLTAVGVLHCSRERLQPGYAEELGEVSHCKVASPQPFLSQNRFVKKDLRTLLRFGVCLEKSDWERLIDSLVRQGNLRSSKVINAM